MNNNMIFAQETYDNPTKYIDDKENELLITDTIHKQKNASHVDCAMPTNEVTMQQKKSESKSEDKTYLFTNYEENVAQQLGTVNGEDAGNIIEGRGVVLNNNN